MVRDAFPAIVSCEQADQIYKQVQARKQVARGKGLKRPSKYLPMSLIICPVCQSHFVVNSNLRKRKFYYIYGTRNRVAQGCSNKILSHQKHFEDHLVEQEAGKISSKGRYPKNSINYHAVNRLYNIALIVNGGDGE